MSRTLLALCAVVLLGGCRLVERDAVLTPLPEGRAFSYEELIARARSTAATALEAFYVDNWPALKASDATMRRCSGMLVLMPSTTKASSAAAARAMASSR